MKRDLRVLYIDSNSVVRNGFGSQYHLSIITGPTVLMQKIVYYLLTENESNYFSPEAGSSFSTLNTISWSPENQTVIKASIASAITEIETKIKTGQILQTLTPEESLKKLELVSVAYDSSDSSWRITINVINLLNQTFTVTL